MKIIISKEEFTRLKRELDENPELDGLEIQINDNSGCKQDPCCGDQSCQAESEADKLKREGDELLRAFDDGD